MAALFLAFTAVVVAGIAAALSRWLDGRRRGAALVGISAWVLYVGALGLSGALASAAAPPRIIFILIPVVLTTMFLVRSDIGRELALSIPTPLLIGAQGFRVVVELFIHQFWSAGLLPRMLTYEGANFDILAGLSAPVVAWLLASRRFSARIVLGWNVLGLMLLANIVVRAILTTPALQLLATEMPNRALGIFPFTFIPGLMAPLALMLHVLSIRALLASIRSNRPSQPAPAHASTTGETS
jgi:hypothetical protein